MSTGINSPRARSTTPKPAATTACSGGMGLLAGWLQPRVPQTVPGRQANGGARRCSSSWVGVGKSHIRARYAQGTRTERHGHTGTQAHKAHRVQKESTRDGTRAHNLLLRREAPYPLGHTSSWHHLVAACHTQSCRGQYVTSHICRAPAALSGQRCRVQEVARGRGCSLEHWNQQPTCPLHDARASCHDCLLWWHGGCSLGGSSHACPRQCRADKRTVACGEVGARGSGWARATSGQDAHNAHAQKDTDTQAHKHTKHTECRRKVLEMGLEPTISSLGGRRLIH